MAVFDPRFELYGITDQPSSLGRDDLTVARALIAGGVTCLQYRAKKVHASEQWAMAAALRRAALDAGIPFIVNDRVDLALDCGADGVHLGQDDAPIAAARRLARLAGRDDLLVGRSTHSPQQALEAAEQGADYIGYGPLYATQTKENNVPALGLGTLSQVLTSVAIPVVAIGGIKAAQLGPLAAQGAQHCAVVTALTGAADISAATRALLGEWRDAKKKGRG